MRFLVALLVLQLALPVWAQPASTPTSQPVLLEMPLGRAIQTPEGRLQGFTFNEFKLLLRIHTDYRAWGKQVPLLELKVLEYQQLVQNHKDQAGLLQGQIDRLKSECSFLNKRWKDENKKRHECEAKPAWGLWIAWGVAGLLAVSTAVLTAVVISHK